MPHIQYSAYWRESAKIAAMPTATETITTISTTLESKSTSIKSFQPSAWLPRKREAAVQHYMKDRAGRGSTLGYSVHQIQDTE
jgi:hypothetical protein